MRIEALKTLLVGLLLACPTGHAGAQALQELRATTIEAAPAEQVAAAEATLRQLREGLARCDGARLYALLPEWELQILPALAFDALHASDDGLLAGLDAQQAALSAYGRAAIHLRAKAAVGDRIEAVQALTGWCEANSQLIQALYGDLASSNWQWLRQDDLQLLSGCAARPVGDGRLSLLWLSGRWQFALLESVETLLLEAFAGPDNGLREALLAQRKSFLDQYPVLPPAPRPADPSGRERLLTLDPPVELDRYANLIEQRQALPPCR